MICPGSGLVRIASPGEPIFFARVQILLCALPSPQNSCLRVPPSALTNSLYLPKIRSAEARIQFRGDGVCMAKWPDWWSWEIEILTHVYDRMLDRDFTETDLRLMLDDATAIAPSHVRGRWVVTTSLHGAAWEIVVEPAPEDHILTIVTAYQVQ